MRQQFATDRFGHARRIAMGAAQRFVDDLVDDAQAFQALGGDAHGLGGFRRLLGGLPEDGGAAFRRDHRIGGVLQHVQLVADTDGQRAAGTALADHGGDDRRLQSRHHPQVPGDRLALAAFLGIDARVGAGRVDEGEDRHLEAFGHFHQAAGLAIAFRTRHAEVAPDLLTDFAAFLVADDHHRGTVEAGNATDDRRVVGEMPVAVQFLEIAEQVADVVEGIGTLGMARELGDLPTGQIAEDVFGERLALVLQTRDFVADVQRIVVAHQAQLFDLGLQVGDRLFEIKKVRVHRLPSCADSSGPFPFGALPYGIGRQGSSREQGRSAFSRRRERNNGVIAHRD